MGSLEQLLDTEQKHYAPTKSAMHRLDWPDALQWPRDLYTLEPAHVRDDDEAAAMAISRLVETVVLVRQESHAVAAYEPTDTPPHRNDDRVTRDVDEAKQAWLSDVTDPESAICREHRGYCHFAQDGADRYEPGIRSLADWLADIIDAIEAVHAARGDAQQLRDACENYRDTVYSVDLADAVSDIWQHVEYADEFEDSRCESATPYVSSEKTQRPINNESASNGGIDDEIKELGKPPYPNVREFRR